MTTVFILLLTFNFEDSFEVKKYYCHFNLLVVLIDLVLILKFVSLFILVKVIFKKQANWWKRLVVSNSAAEMSFIKILKLTDLINSLRFLSFH